MFFFDFVEEEEEEEEYPEDSLVVRVGWSGQGRLTRSGMVGLVSVTVTAREDGNMKEEAGADDGDVREGRGRW